MKKNEDDYIIDKEFHTDNAHIIIYRPIISKEENERRIEQLKHAMTSFMKEYYRTKD